MLATLPCKNNYTIVGVTDFALTIKWLSLVGTFISHLGVFFQLKGYQLVQFFPSLHFALGKEVICP